MAWLFERTIELAAWVALALGLVCLVNAGYLAYQIIRLWIDDQTAPELMYRAGQSAGAFVLFALAMGALACIDRYVFDQPEPSKR